MNEIDDLNPMYIPHFDYTNYTSLVEPQIIAPPFIFYENHYEKAIDYLEKAHEHMDKLEKQVTNFIKEEWNQDLSLCVDFEDTGVLSIWIGEEIEKEYFYQFIIKPICERYGLKLVYTECVTLKDDEDYVEWGLSSKK